MILDPDDAPLLPAEPPCRVGIYPSDSIYPAEACVTAMVSAAGDRVAWTDIRDFPGYHTPVMPDPDIASGDGGALQIPDLVFDAAQYRAEVARTTADRSWETDELKTARLLRQRLRRAQDRLAALGWRPEFAEARRPGFWVAFRDAEDAQLIVALPPEPGTAEQQAAMMADLLLSTPQQEWPVIHCSACELNDPRDLGGSAAEDAGTARRRPLHAHSPAAR